jgi:hypothetical protein
MTGRPGPRRLPSGKTKRKVTGGKGDTEARARKNALGEELLGSSIDFSRNLGRCLVRLREEMLVHFQNGQEEF